jgi:16S rRNA C967 or C1407 C5-methylase (RsmB/RsmF family)
MLNEPRLNDLQDLQRELLNNGFQMLKKEGIMIYSTCSLSPFQNELIISWFLNNNPNAQLLPTTIASKFKQESCIPHHENICKYTSRLHPKNSNTSSMFIAKIKKLY